MQVVGIGRSAHSDHLRSAVGLTRRLTGQMQAFQGAFQPHFCQRVACFFGARRCSSRSIDFPICQTSPAGLNLPICGDSIPSFISAMRQCDRISAHAFVVSAAAEVGAYKRPITSFRAADDASAAVRLMRCRFCATSAWRAGYAAQRWRRAER